MTTRIYEPVPTYAEALAAVIADIRTKFPTWTADPSDPIYYIAELIAQGRVDNRTLLNESRRALVWPTVPGVDGAGSEDLLELARGVAIASTLPDETPAHLLERMNRQWLGLSETDFRVRLLVLSRPGVIDMSQENGEGYQKTVYIQTDLTRGSTADERHALQEFLRGPTGAPWHVISTVEEETRVPYDLDCVALYTGDREEVATAVTAGLLRAAAQFQRLDTDLFDDGLKAGMWYEDRATGSRVLDFPTFDIGGDRDAAVDTVYHLNDYSIDFQYQEEPIPIDPMPEPDPRVPDAPGVRLTGIFGITTIRMFITVGNTNGAIVTGATWGREDPESGGTAVGGVRMASFSTGVEVGVGAESGSRYRARLLSDRGPGAWSEWITL